MAKTKEGKNALMSKTVWANLVMALVGVASARWPESGITNYVNIESLALFFGFTNVLLRGLSKDKIWFF